MQCALYIFTILAKHLEFFRQIVFDPWIKKFTTVHTVRCHADTWTHTETVAFRNFSNWPKFRQNHIPMSHIKWTIRPLILPWSANEKNICTLRHPREEIVGSSYRRIFSTKMAGLPKMLSNVEERRTSWYFPCRGCRNDGISVLFGGGVHNMCHVTETFWYVALISVTTGQMLSISSKSGVRAHTLWKTMHDIQRPLSRKTDTISWLTFLRPEHLSGYCAQLCPFTENCVHAECQRSWPTVAKFIVSDYTRYADQGQKFLRHVVARDKI
jgi:hypothetical protein